MSVILTYAYTKKMIGIICLNLEAFFNFNYRLTQHEWTWIRKIAIYNFRSRRFVRPVSDVLVRLALFNRIYSYRDYPIYHNFSSNFLLRLQKSTDITGYYRNNFPWVHICEIQILCHIRLCASVVTKSYSSWFSCLKSMICANFPVL